MLAKAVAHHTTAAFIRVVGSEFVQKYLGEVRTAACCKAHHNNLSFLKAATWRCEGRTYMAFEAHFTMRPALLIAC